MNLAPKGLKVGADPQEVVTGFVTTQGCHGGF